MIMTLSFELVYLTPRKKTSYDYENNTEFRISPSESKKKESYDHENDIEFQISLSDSQIN